MPSPVLGIDLGTTNSVVACADEHRVRVLRDEDGQLITPSAVSFEPSGRMLVGHRARERRLLDAPNTIFSVKRLIGRPFRSPEVRRAAARLPFELEEGPTGGVAVRVRGESYSLPEISSFILHRMRALAESAVGQPCTNAVITVPANFNELQRMATRDAGRIAGLNVLRILNEPTAAALAYGYRAKQGQRIAVYDLGGGTFDISILELSGDVIEVVATAGDTNLGGDDLDGAVADRMVAVFEQQHGLNLASDPQQYERVRLAAEWIKCQLSHQESAEAIVKEVARVDGQRAIDLRFRLSRGELQQLVGPLITRTFASCEEAMRLANVRPTQLDGVIMVGGQTRTPTVRQLVAEFFGLQPQTSVDPELVVAQGAALQGYALSGAAPTGGAGRSSLLGKPPVSGAYPDDVMPKVAGQDEFEDEPTRVGQDDELSLRKRSEIEFEDLPTTVAFRDDPDEELTKIGEYMTAREVEEVLASARELPAAPKPSLSSTQPGVGPISPPQVASARTAPGVGPSLAPPRSRAHPPEPQRARAAKPAPITRPLKPASGLSAAPSIRVPPKAPSAARAPAVAPSLSAARPPLPAAPPAAAPPGPAPAIEPAASSAPASPAPASLLGAAVASTSSIPPALAESEAELSRAASRLRERAPERSSRSSSAAETRPVGRRPANDSSDAAVIDGSLFLSESTLLRSQFPGPPSMAPLLLDVTPHTLSVETAGGFCEPIIERNAPIPTEQTRVFSTSQDDQVMVSVRVCQGESRRTDENQSLGQIQLLGLRRGRRGEVSIAVTFIIDADGTLNVKATDRTTGQGQAIRVDLVGAIGERDLERMRERQRLASLI